MIQPQELRIGNYVMCYSEHVSTVTTLWESKIVTTKDFSCLSVSSDEVSGIELTEEWLVKLGFEYYKPLNHHRITIGDVWYSVNQKGYFSFVNLAGDETATMPNTKVNSVHHLQNLFYSISGQELTTKE